MGKNRMFQLLIEYVLAHFCRRFVIYFRMLCLLFENVL